MDFDINSINSMYNNYIRENAASGKASNMVDAAKDYSKASDDELMSVCKEFESYFLEQCFKEMMKTVGNEESSSAATSTLVDFYKDSFVQEMAKQSTEQNSLGLAQTLYEQMKRNYDVK